MSFNLPRWALPAFLVTSATTVFLYPPLKYATAEKRCADNLRKIYGSTMLYQADWTQAREGEYYDMGLPIPGNSVASLKIYRYFGACGGPQIPDSHRPRVMPYTYMVCLPIETYRGAKWNRYVAHVHENAILFTDLHHSKVGTLFQASEMTKVGIGVTLGGTAVKRIARGNPDRYKWWSP